MINGSYFVQSDPCGQITGNQYQNVMKRKEADYFKKHHASTHRMFGNIFTLNDKPFKEKLYQDEHVTVLLSELQNYNPTSKGVDYFEENETNKMLHHPESKHFYSGINHRNTKIIDEIDEKRKKNIKYHYPEHSHRLLPIIR